MCFDNKKSRYNPLASTPEQFSQTLQRLLSTLQGNRTNTIKFANSETLDFKSTRLHALLTFLPLMALGCVKKNLLVGFVNCIKSSDEY